MVCRQAPYLLGFKSAAIAAIHRDFAETYMSNQKSPRVNSTVTRPLCVEGPSKPPLLNVVAMLSLAIMWGLSIPITKLGLVSLSPMVLTTLRYAVAVPLLFILVMGRYPLPWQAMPRVAALGVIGIGVGQVAQAYGVAGTTASIGTIVSATIPLFIVFFAAIRLRQPVSGLQKLGLTAAFSGIALVALGNGTHTISASLSSNYGAAYVLLSALAIAFYYVWSVELTQKYGMACVTAWSTLFGFIALLPWAGWEIWHTPIHLTAQAIGVAIYLGVVVTVIGLFLWLNLLRTVPARIAASVQYLQPLIGVAAASAMFGDQLGITFVPGVALVLGGLVLVMKSRNEIYNVPQ
jgi:drug/metabolite transporter (DMT)-like permease